MLSYTLIVCYYHLFSINPLEIQNIQLINPRQKHLYDLLQEQVQLLQSNQISKTAIFKLFQTQCPIAKMADIIRVKARKNFEWEQDNKYIFVRVPMAGHTTLKNIQIFLSDLILRITSKQKKFVQTLDLLNQVDYLSHENKFVLVDGVVSATLKKKTQQKWETLLIEDISLAELKARRKQSETRYEQNIKETNQNKQKLKTQYDRKATQELMRFQEEERKKLDKRKEDEKQAALNEVFRNIDEKTGKIEYDGNKWQEKGSKALEQLQKEQRQEYQRQKQQRKRAQLQKYQKNDLPQPPRQTNKNAQIFTEEDIKQYDQIRNNIQQQMEQIPVRKQAKVGVKFTQKLYPMVATRDYHYTEPPMPKGSAPLPPPRQGDLENRNPLWLKDRGDGFMRNKNYSAALDAYNQAIKIDPSQRKTLMNRSLAHLKLLNLDSAINDCDLILSKMQKQLVNNEDNKQESLQDLIKIKTRKSICLACKGKLTESKELITQILLTYNLNPQQRQQLHRCLQTIEKRQSSVKTKLRGDECVKRQLYEEALKYYEEAIQIDGNEYALSNKGLCLNKLGKFQEAIEVCERGIKAVQQFMASSSGNNKNIAEYSTILIKLLYRKSTAQEGLKQLKEAQGTLKRALQLNPEDKDIKSALKSVRSEQQSQQFLILKEQASVQLTQNSNPQQALSLYTKCLKLVESPDKVQSYLSILQNQCVCYLKLQQYDSIVAVSIRILSIINNLKSKVIQFEGNREGKQNGKNGLTKKVLDKIVVRTLMRRANAYIKLGQIYNAKADLEKAVDIDPTDPNTTKELDKLKQSLGS